MIRVQEAWETGRGKGATVAILDTGVEFNHEDLRGQLLTGRNFVRKDRSAQDDNGQGTHLAGLVAAVRNNGVGIAGVAPESVVLPVKVLDAEDEGTEANILEGIRFSIERKASVLLLDLDRDVVLSENGANFKKAIQDAFSAGVLPVLAAEHPYLSTPEFADAPAIVVAGVTREGKQSPYSNSAGVGSAKWGMAAPGGVGDGSENDVFSTMWPHTRQAVGGERQEFGRYAYDADQVQAAAHVAGAAAILRGLGESAQSTVDRLLKNTKEAGGRGRDQIFGQGILDLAASVKGLKPAPPAPTTTTTTTKPPSPPGLGLAAPGGPPAPRHRPPFRPARRLPWPTASRRPRSLRSWAIPPAQHRPRRARSPAAWRPPRALTTGGSPSCPS
jgi:subtilisin family serine protease